MKTKIFRSPYSNYYGDEIKKSLGVYTNNYLMQLAREGFSAIWLRAILRDVSKNDAITEYGNKAQENQNILNKLIKRCSKHRLKVYIYFNEPLTHPQTDKFWDHHPNLRGTSGTSPMDNWPQTWALCSSQPQVIDFLTKGINNLFSNCQKLGGVFLITRSEHHTHCYSHTETPDCPLCSTRNPADILADVINAIEKGIHTAAPEAEVIAWNWAWPLDKETEIISKLNKNVIVMADFERGGYKNIAGQERLIDEYSLSYTGPSDRFRTMYNNSIKNQRKIYAKLQIGTTHELATVINLPLIPNLLKKVRWLKKANIDGTLCCWNFGNMFSLNTFAFNQFCKYDLDSISDHEAMVNLAKDYFKIQDSSKILKAWELFKEAFDNYPFCVSFLYLGPINYALSYPLPQKGKNDIPMQRSWIPLQTPIGTQLIDAVCSWQGEDMSCEAKEGCFTLKEIVECLQKMTKLFEFGMLEYREILGSCNNKHARKELKNSEFINASIKSTRNIFEAYFLTIKTVFDDKKWKNIAKEEILNLDKILPLLKEEKEIGYHSEAQEYFFNENTVRRKRNELYQLIS